MPAIRARVPPQPRRELEGPDACHRLTLRRTTDRTERSLNGDGRGDPAGLHQTPAGSAGERARPGSLAIGWWPEQTTAGQTRMCRRDKGGSVVDEPERPHVPEEMRASDQERDQAVKLLGEH